MIRSVVIWHIDKQGTLQRHCGWRRTPATEQGASPPVEPLPCDEAGNRMRLHGKSQDAVFVSWPVGNRQDGSAPWVVLECAPAATTSAAVEHWHLDAGDESAMGLRDAWYTESAMPMARLSRHTTIRVGFGLPGLSAQLHSPVYLGNLGSSELFVRVYSAMQMQLQHGLALPTADGRHALVLLTGNGSALARRVELSVLQGKGMRRLVGHCQREGPLDARDGTPPWGSDRLRACAESGAPLLLSQETCDAAAGADLQALGAQALLALPYDRQDGGPVVMALWL